MDDVADLSGLKPFAAAGRREMGPCKRCRFAVKDGPDLTCHEDSPQCTVLLVPVQVAAPPGALVRPGQQQVGMAPQIFTSWPVVKGDHGCFKFEAKAGATN